MFENDQQQQQQQLQQQQYILQESISVNSSTMVLASSPHGSSPMNTNNNNEHNINVVIRVRPIITPPRTLNKSIIHQINNGEVVVDQRYGRQQQQQHADETDADQSTAITFPAAGQIQVQDNIANVSRSFSFNVVFEPEATQEEVFEHSGVKRLIDMALDGFACTVFAYGQTSTGKTYTLTGNAFQLARENLSSASSSTTSITTTSTSSNLRNNKNWKNSNNKKHNSSQSIEQPAPPSSHQQDNNDKPLMKNIGIVQLSFAYLFEQIKRRKNRDKTLYVITVSYLEVYNEQVLDLLNPSPRSLNVRWAKDRGFYAENLFKVECEDLGDLEGVLEEGCKNRQVRSHSMNENSSRSHSVMTITLHSETADPEDPQGFIHKEGRLCLVDLAGSEKTKRTNSKGGTFVEANNINRSLLVLGNCIACLADPKRRNGHIPYRDSTLTKLLADSLSGNGMTLMIACVSPAKCDAQETISTLRYASRAKRVRMNPVVQMDPRELLILSLKREVRLLKMENYYLKQNYNLQQQQDNSNSNEMNLKLLNGKTNGNSESNGIGSIDQMNLLDKVMKENEVLRVENVQVNLQRNRLIRDHELVCRENEQLLRKLNILLYKMNPNLQSSNSTTTTAAAVASGIFNSNNNNNNNTNGGGLFSSASSPSILSLAYDDDIRGRVSQISQDQQHQQPNKVQAMDSSSLTNNRNLFVDVHHQSIDDNNDLIIIRNNNQNQNQKVSNGTKSNHQTNNSNRSSQVTTTTTNQNGIYSEQDNVNRGMDLIVRGKSAVQNKSTKITSNSRRNH